ncbi:hypothetical protein MJ904_13155 [Massilia sp. MB5]|uniref:hypothetical protein n=1 Tax=Massilia sp. MB5 TaxID=2919578 RepID=UPI001F0FF8C9|nr:hypothetical protein [Massilia sp. MB5]UMR33024.1 hypothetical protein MJ904_13155 [Massilia sp. MB5]
MSLLGKDRSHHLFGQLLVRHKLISEEQLQKAIEHQRATGQRLGEIFAEWELITQQHVHDILRRQRRVRMAAAFIAALFAPLESFAVQALPATAVAVQPLLPSRQESMQALSEAEMDAVTAQGLQDDVVHEIEQHMKDRNVKIIGDMARLINPVLGFLEADVSMHNVVYDHSRALTTLNADGSLTLSLPSSIGEISLRNIRVQGSNPDGPSFGSISMKGIDLTGTTITLMVKH